MSFPVPAASAPIEQATPRARRRAQTREEILDAALAVMAERGVAALNLTEVARRVGLRQPSLYQYFDSRYAVYDALFERGMQAHHDILAAAIDRAGDGWAGVRAAARETLRFATDEPVLAQLLFTPAVPGFVPSEQAYAPSLRASALMSEAIAAAVTRGELHPAAASENGAALLVALIAGVASQQVANDPGAGITTGRFVVLLDPALDMYAAYFNPDNPPTWTPWLQAEAPRDG
jgi:AcrR family transcriptional regulator